MENHKKAIYSFLKMDWICQAESAVHPSQRDSDDIYCARDRSDCSSVKFNCGFQSKEWITATPFVVRIKLFNWTESESVSMPELFIIKYFESFCDCIESSMSIVHREKRRQSDFLYPMSTTDDSLRWIFYMRITVTALFQSCARCEQVFRPQRARVVHINHRHRSWVTRTQ